MVACTWQAIRSASRYAPRIAAVYRPAHARPPKYPLALRIVLASLDVITYLLLALIAIVAMAGVIHVA